MVKAPGILRSLYKRAVWSIPDAKQEVFLSYDDGPHPEITPALLDLLDEYQAKASFFLIGKNAKAQPHLVNEYLKRGHRIGNHSFSHRNLFFLDKKKLRREISECDAVFKSDMFRPPYGKLRPDQLSTIDAKFKIVMWDVLSKDYSGISAKKSFENVKRYAKPGSIIVLHENNKSKEIIIELSRYCLEYFQSRNWKCTAINFKES